MEVRGGTLMMEEVGVAGSDSSGEGVKKSVEGSSKSVSPYSSSADGWNEGEKGEKGVHGFQFIFEEEDVHSDDDMGNEEEEEEIEEEEGEVEEEREEEEGGGGGGDYDHLVEKEGEWDDVMYDEEKSEVDESEESDTGTSYASGALCSLQWPLVEGREIPDCVEEFRKTNRPWLNATLGNSKNAKSCIESHLKELHPSAMKRFRVEKSGIDAIRYTALGMARSLFRRAIEVEKYRNSYFDTCTDDQNHAEQLTLSKSGMHDAAISMGMDDLLPRLCEKGLDEGISKQTKRKKSQNLPKSKLQKLKLHSELLLNS
eukprot:Nk52_evm55s2118 gene=Nk52_evmTU55s2118